MGFTVDVCLNCCLVCFLGEVIADGHRLRYARDSSFTQNGYVNKCSSMLVY